MIGPFLPVAIEALHPARQVARKPRGSGQRVSRPYRGSQQRLGLRIHQGHRPGLIQRDHSGRRFVDDGLRALRGAHQGSARPMKPLHHSVERQEHGAEFVGARSPATAPPGSPPPPAPDARRRVRIGFASRRPTSSASPSESAIPVTTANASSRIRSFCSNAVAPASSGAAEASTCPVWKSPIRQHVFPAPATHVRVHEHCIAVRERSVDLRGQPGILDAQFEERRPGTPDQLLRPDREGGPCPCWWAAVRTCPCTARNSSAASATARSASAFGRSNHGPVQGPGGDGGKRESGDEKEQEQGERDLHPKAATSPGDPAESARAGALGCSTSQCPHRPATISRSSSRTSTVPATSTAVPGEFHLVVRAVPSLGETGWSVRPAIPARSAPSAELPPPATGRLR